MEMRRSSKALAMKGSMVACLGSEATWEESLVGNAVPRARYFLGRFPMEMWRPSKALIMKGSMVTWLGSEATWGGSLLGKTVPRGMGRFLLLFTIEISGPPLLSCSSDATTRLSSRCRRASGESHWRERHQCTGKRRKPACNQHERISALRFGRLLLCELRHSCGREIDGIPQLQRFFKDGFFKDTFSVTLEMGKGVALFAWH